jgi:hypothetical protein
MNQDKKILLKPGYISGLTQSDGSFFCSLSLSPRSRFGLQFRPKFSITTDLDSKYVLDNILSFFKCGDITINIKNYTAELVVDRLEDINNIIIPHFNNYPVFCAKLHAFNLFKEIVTVLINKEKRTIEGRRELLKMALSMNYTNNRTEERINLLYSLLDVTNIEDKELIPISTLEVESNLFTEDHLSGIIDGDGSVYISFQSNGEIKTGFNITSDNHSKSLLETIQNKLKGIGSIKIGSKNELVFTVTGINQIVDILIPFIDKNPLHSKRALHYEKFKLVSLMLKNNKSLTLKTKLDIVELCYEMNKKGKHRLYSKLEYIELLKKIHNKN